MLHNYEQITARTYALPTPTAALLRLWPRAWALAERYWALLAQDARLRESFRGVGVRSLAALRAAGGAGGTPIDATPSFT